MMSNEKGRGRKRKMRDDGEQNKEEGGGEDVRLRFLAAK